jgi:intein/homing endonuclease
VVVSDYRPFRVRRKPSEYPRFKLRRIPDGLMIPEEDVIASVSSHKILDEDNYDPSQQVPISELVIRIVTLAQVMLEKQFYPYQVSLSSRLIESLLLHDGDVITCLMSRQAGKTETVGGTVAAASVALPALAKQFPKDWKLNITDENGNYRGFAFGLKCGIYAPRLDQSSITFERVRHAFDTKSAQKVMREMKLTAEVNNGNTFELSNGSSILCESASEQSKIEGATHHFLVAEECQDISDLKLKKSLHPMTAATMGCLTGDVLVELGDGRRVRIDKLVNDARESLVRSVASESLSNLSLCNREIEHFHDNGVKPTLLVKLSSGQSVASTHNHKFVKLHNIRRNQWNWVCADKLSKGDRIAVACEFREGGITELSPYPELLGYVISEGGVTDNRIEIGASNPKVIKDIKELAIAFDPYSKVVYRKRSIRVVKLHRNSGGPKNKRTRLQSQLVSDGVMGKSSHTKRIPDRCFSWNSDARARLLSTLFCGDGCFCGSKSTCISYSTVNPDLASDVQALLSSLGIFSRAIPVKYRTPAGKKGVAHCVRVDEVYSQKEFLRLCGWRRDFGKYAKTRKALLQCKGKSKILSVRFVKISSIEDGGKQQTYDLQVSSSRNYVANGIVAHNTIAKIGTASTQKCDFYNSIQENKRMELLTGKRNHFFFPWSVCSKYNSLYRKYIDKEKNRIGEDSDEFRMSYDGTWIFERGMFVTQDVLFHPDCAKIQGLWSTYHWTENQPGALKYLSLVAGIDWGSMSDSTVICLMAVDWLNPIESGEVFDSLGAHRYIFYRKHVVGWLEFIGDNYEYQFGEIKMQLDRLPNLRKIIMDSNACGKPMYDRFSAVYAEREVEVEPFNFQPKVKSDGYKSLSNDLWAGRITFPASKTVRVGTVGMYYRKFVFQMLDLKKDYRNGVMNVSHPDERGAHDDFCDALMVGSWGCNTPSVSGHVEASVGNPFMN